jgi:hypothetical protein
MDGMKLSVPRLPGSVPGYYTSNDIHRHKLNDLVVDDVYTNWSQFPRQECCADNATEMGTYTQRVVPTLYVCHPRFVID